ncbi:MAG: hypothetical protein ACT4PE_13045 [Candidatus Eiseniibacteriota bacterium]
MTRRQVLERAAFPAALVAAIGLALLVRPEAPPDVGRLARAEPLRAPAVSPGDLPALGDAVAHYEAGRWREAAAGFAGLIALAGEGWPRRDEARLFLGSSLLLDAQPHAATEPLAAAAASTDATVSVRAKWCLAQAHLARGDIGAARPLLDDLSRTPAYARPASELLLELRGK